MSNQQISKQKQEKPYSFVKKQGYKGQQSSPEQCQNRLINQTINMPLLEQSLKQIKKLMLKHGAPILIFLKPFYDKITQQFKQGNIQNLKALASIAEEIVERTDIPQINYIFQFGKKTYDRRIGKESSELKFIKIFSQMGLLNQQIINKKSRVTRQQYQKIMENNIKNSNLNNLMIKAIEYYHTQCTNILNYKDNKNEEESEQNQNQQEFGDYYSMSQRTKNNSISSIQNISYSLEQDSMNVSMIKEKKMLCCRTYLMSDQVITDQEDDTTTFLQIKYPFSNDARIQIQRAICSFLNCQGGKIYLGTRKDEKNRRIFNTDIYTQSQREQLLKQIRKMMQIIDDQLIIQNMCAIQFIPLKQKNGQYIPGACVIRITVNYGKSDQLYCYQKDGIFRFPFKNESEFIEKQGKELLRFYKNKLKSPLQMQRLPIHFCKKPEVGQLLYQKNQKIKNMKKQKEQKVQVQKQKQKQQQQIKSTVYSSYTDDSTRDSSKIRQDNFQQDKVKYSYFFVLGLSEKNLAPIFESKGVDKSVKVQSIKQQNKLIVRVVNEGNVTETVRKILRKIEQKYKQKKIKVYEMSLVLQTQNLVKAVQLLKQINSKFQVSGNCIKFKLFRQSFQAFNCLEAYKVPVKFIFSKG